MKNEGEMPQYYIEESHEAIISPEEFEEVQSEMARRKKLGRKYSGSTIFSAKLVCGDCGSFFGSKVWHSTSKSEECRIRIVSGRIQQGLR